MTVSSHPVPDEMNGQDSKFAIPQGPSLSPDGSAVYFSTFRPGVEGRRLVRIPLEGGEPEDLGWGADPAVSPGGDRLAYRACTESGCGQELVVLDLRTGEETRVGSGDVDLQVGKTVWLPDGRLVVELLPPMDYSYGSPYRVIDPARAPPDLVDAPSLPNPPNTGEIGLYGYHAPTAGAIVGQFIQGEGPSPGGPVRYVSVDPDTGEVLATVVRGGWWQVHPDASGRDLLLLDFRDRVYVSRDGSDPQPIAEGFSDLAW